jgi:hypothetical protein
MTATPLLAGTRIRYTINNLGLVGNPGEVNDGDEGVVIGPGTEPEWIYTEPDKYPQTICPVHESMIEAVA